MTSLETMKTMMGILMQNTSTMTTNITHLTQALLETNVRAANGFTWGPILEVAKLFIGIFICMIPALKILQAGIDGSLSTVVSSPFRQQPTIRSMRCISG